MQRHHERSILMKQRRWKQSAAWLLSLALILGVSLPARAQAAASDVTLYKGGDIVTVNDAQPTAEAVATKDGKIIAVGTLADVEAKAGSQARVIDLKGKTMIPGFYDAHSHFLWTGTTYLTQARLFSPPMGTVKDMNGIIKALSDWRDAHPDDPWIVGMGYDDGEIVEKRHPTADDLDKVSKDKPIFITHFSGHNIVANHKALELAGISKDTKDPEGGQIGRDKDGNPNGQLWETAMRPVQALVPPLSEAKQIESLRTASELYAKAGMTTVNEGAGGNLQFNYYLKGVNQGVLKQHVNYWFTDWKYAAEMYKKYPKGNESVHYTGKDDLLQLTGVKMFCDGSPQLRTAFMTDPYYTTGEYPKDWVAYPRVPHDKMMANVLEAHQLGINQLYIHGNGDAAIDQVLDCFEAIDKGVKDGTLRKPTAPMRHVVIHSQFSREEQYQRMAKIGAIPSFLMMHPYFLGDRHWDIYFGAERAARMSATRDAANNHLRYSLHSDAPVFPVDALLMLQTAVERKSYSGRDIFTTTYDKNSKYRSVDQRITPAEALKALTLDAAYDNGEDAVAGSIEVGKRADFAILGANPLKVATSTIKDIPVKATIVNGQPIYDPEGLFGQTPTVRTQTFSDIDGHWAAKDIERAVQAKRAAGLSATTYGPDQGLTRAMAVTMLYRMAGQPATPKTDAYRDVAATDWYATPVAWAKANGIAKGKAADRFAPNDLLTREEAAAMLAGYHRMSKASFAAKPVPAPSFQDTPSAWAKTSVQWAVTSDLLRGTDKTHLAPKATLTRAQWVVMTNRYLDRLAK